MLYRCLPPLVLATAQTHSPGIHAAEWVAEPSVNLRASYDDNIRLTAADHNSVWGAILDPRLKLSRRTELWDLNASGRIRGATYTNDDNLDTIDTYFDLAAKRAFERGNLNITASQVNDTTLQDEILDTDTGLVTVQVDRTTQDIGFTGQYLFAEDTWLEASIRYTTAKYEEGDLYGLLDYDYLTPGLRVIHQLNPQTQLFGILSHARTNYDTVSELESKTNSLQLGASYDITETWKVTGSAGGRLTDTSSLVPTAVERPGLEPFYPYIYDIIYIPRDSESSGMVYDVNLSRELESGNLSLAATRSVTPSSTGTDTDTSQIDLTGTHHFSAKLSTRLAVSYYQSSTVGDATTRADRDRYRVTPSLNWRLDKDLVLNTGYTYTRVDRAVNDEQADNNAVFANISYAWPPLSVSR